MESFVGLEFFDSDVSLSTKRKMVKAMMEKPPVSSQKKKASVPIKSFSAKSLEDFVIEKTSCLFRMMDLPDSFLEVDPELWPDRDDFRQAVAVFHGMKVVNDHAERGVALIQEFSGLLTKDEPQLQYLLQVVEEHRHAYPDCRKQTLSADQLDVMISHSSQ